MIYFFTKRYAIFATLLFVSCANNAMESIIPYEFCGKMIKKNPAYEKISVKDQAGNFIVPDMCAEIGQHILGTNLIMPCQNILVSWTGTYSLNQYFNFVALVSKVAKKLNFKVDIVLHFIHEKYESDFFEGLEATKMYKKLYEKIKINNPIDLLTADEYTFLNNVLIGKYAVLKDGDKVQVKRTMIEKFYPAKELTKYLITVQAINIVPLSVFYGMGFFSAKETVLSDIIATPFQLLWCFFCDNNNLPILKPYEPKIID